MIRRNSAGERYETLSRYEMYIVWALQEVSSEHSVTYITNSKVSTESSVYDES